MRKFIRRLLLMVCLAILPAGFLCRLTLIRGESGNSYFFYSINKGETKLVQEKYEPEDESTQAMVKELVTVLNDRESGKENQALFPEDVEITSFEIEDSTLQLIFETSYSGMSRAREILVRAGVVQAFLQVPGIAGVQFFVGDGELTDSKGNVIGVMDDSSFVELSGEQQDAYRHDSFTLYFTDSTGEKLVQETRSVYYKRNLPKERVILEQLAKGPMVKDHYPTIPESAELLNVTTADQVCYVDFNASFTEAALDLPEKTIIYSVVNSLLTAIDAEKVQISVEGAQDATIGDGVSLYNFYSLNEDLVLSE